MGSGSRRRNADDTLEAGRSAIDLLREHVPRPVKSGLKRAARLPERLLHPWRRRRARERLAEVAPRSRSVLFVCHGNICRSPVAERLLVDALNEKAGSRIRVGSTGFYPKEDRNPPRAAVKAAARLNVDLSSHSSRSLQSGNGRNGEPDEPIVFVMEPGQSRRYRQNEHHTAREIFVLGDFDPQRIRVRGIRDPFGHPPLVFDEVFERIQRCVDETARIMERRIVGPASSKRG